MVSKRAEHASLQQNNTLIQSELNGAIELLESMNFGFNSRPWEALRRIQHIRELLVERIRASGAAEEPIKPLTFTRVGVIAEPLGYLEVFFEGGHCLSLNWQTRDKVKHLYEALERFLKRVSV